MIRRVQLALLGSTLLLPLAAQAYTAGDVILRAGPALVDPHDSSGDVHVGSTRLDGWQVSVDSDVQLGLTGSYLLTDHIGVGLLASTPFKHDIKGAGPALSGAGKLAEIKHLPPTLTLQYFPLNSASRLQPYVGLGINYTIFFDEQTTPTLTNALGAASTDIDLDNSFGLAAELGVDMMLTDHIGLNAALWWIDIDTDATIKAYDGAGNRVATGNVDVSIDPMVYMVGVSYRF